MVDFKEQLRRQIKFIRNSCALYDNGDFEEAVRIAVSLRVLFHDSPNSTSLLAHLGAKPTPMLSTAPRYADHPVMPTLSLVRLIANLNLTDDNRKADFRCRCQPLLDKSSRNQIIMFRVWWEKELVIKHKQPRTKLTRKDLVLAAANKDGGAHVDAILNPTYEYAGLGSGLSLQIDLNPKLALPSQKAAFENVHFATLRQIAYEVLNSRTLLALT